MTILDKVQPANLCATKNVFVAAIRFATAIDESCPAFGQGLKTSAQEQVEYMLGEEADILLVTADDEVRSEVRKGLLKLSSIFEKEISVLNVEAVTLSSVAENETLKCLTDLEWMCNILQKIDLMKEFVLIWAKISDNIITVVQDDKFQSDLWGLKLKLTEVTGKVLDAVGYGNVIIPAPCRIQLLKTWVPYLQKMKPQFDSMADTEINFMHKMEEDLCQSIEGAITSLLLALPANDQADIFTDWMTTEHLSYPDLSEAFEIWCYRAKSAKRRLLEGVSDTTVTL